ncbi:hypothetical protein KUH03_01780 [Sphingobacterium sp. E70]|uniref:hypothetical protein n=1 Tax=Sphingobacterium sp. E70 TaxID=2853439 RepID=UPI00211BDFA5|nr:hypothetical protein [Sphingobacterium sp. E70]ULT25754.1 hypothetical protein KUH03_01780 [Sphingobacterium sp. E70]
MYRIAILDEVNDDIERFQRYVHKNDKDKRFCVVEIMPKPNFEDTINEILCANLDALISDYRLNEFKANITYDGVKVVNSILERRALFPCFVLTSFDDDAVKDSEDGNIVYIKGVMGGESNAKITFLERIGRQIEKYRFKIQEAKSDLEELLNIRKTRLLTPTEENSYIELCNFLGESYVGEDSLPRPFFGQDTNKRLDEILLKADKILKTSKMAQIKFRKRHHVEEKTGKFLKTIQTIVKP